MCCGHANAESGNAESGQATTLLTGRLPVGNWGCAEAGGVVYLYYLLCRYLVLLVLTHAQRGGVG